MMGEPCYCGDPTCPRCFPGSFQQARQEEHHDLFHEVHVPDCPYCVQARVGKILDRCDRMRVQAGKGPLPADMRRKLNFRA